MVSNAVLAPPSKIATRMDEGRDGTKLTAFTKAFAAEALVEIFTVVDGRSVGTWCFDDDLIPVATNSRGMEESEICPESDNVMSNDCSEVDCNSTCRAAESRG